MLKHEAFGSVSEGFFFPFPKRNAELPNDRIILPRSWSGIKIAVEINCMLISSPVDRTFLKINHNKVNKIECFRRLSVLPCKNESDRTRFTFCISSLNTRSVCSRSFLTSGKVNPRLQWSKRASSCPPFTLTSRTVSPSQLIPLPNSIIV